MVQKTLGKRENLCLSGIYIFLIAVIIIATLSFLLACLDLSLNSVALYHPLANFHLPYSKLLLHIQWLYADYFVSSQACVHSISSFLDLNYLKYNNFLYPFLFSRIKKAPSSTEIPDNKTIMKNYNPFYMHSALHFSKNFHIDYIMI